MYRQDLSGTIFVNQESWLSQELLDYDHHHLEQEREERGLKKE
jgi:hypothetical protein